MEGKILQSFAGYYVDGGPRIDEDAVELLSLALSCYIQWPVVFSCAH